MKGFGYFPALALALALVSCAGKGGVNTVDSSKVDTTPAVDSALLPDSLTADSLTIDSVALDSAFRADSAAFSRSIPDPRGLCLMELNAGTVDKYLPTLGYRPVGKNKWQLKVGGITSTVEWKDSYFESLGNALIFEVTITGAPSALEQYYQLAKDLEYSGFGNNYSAEKVGNTVFTQEVGI